MVWTKKPGIPFEDTRHVKMGYIKNTKLFFANLEHFGAADGTSSLSRRAAVLHGYLLGIFHLTLGATFHAITFHVATSFPLCSTR